MSGRKNPLEILEEGLDGVRILVVGDLMLDQTLSGSVGRISPEAPIPVLKAETRKDGLGGAGNVANNLSRLGCRVALIGVIGKDPEASLLIGLLEREGIESRILVTKQRCTTRKMRVVSARQQMLRMDFETTDPVDDSTENELIRRIMTALDEGPDAVILSDYGKGVCTPRLCRTLLDGCRERKVPVLVDPKGADWERYRGCTLITPNLNELCLAARRTIPNEDRDVEQAARELMNCFELDRILVTRSDRGMSLFSGESALHEKTVAREVFDVSGAGDTVVAVVTAFLAAGASLEEAVRAANRAAGFVVGKAGTYAISRQDLLMELHQGARSASLSKVVPLDRARSLVEAWKSGGQRIVFTNGCFDILHAGHLFCLEKAKSLGDRLIVGLNSDASVRKLKGPGRPVNPESFRAMLLAALFPVDLVVLFEEETPLKLIEALKPDCLVKGGDYRPEEVVGSETVASWGGEVVIVPRIEGLSTTAILQSVLQKDAGGISQSGKGIPDTEAGGGGFLR